MLIEMAAVDLNKDDPDTLKELPGVGQRKAEAIVALREEGNLTMEMLVARTHIPQATWALMFREGKIKLDVPLLQLVLEPVPFSPRSLALHQELKEEREASAGKEQLAEEEKQENARKMQRMMEEMEEMRRELKQQLGNQKDEFMARLAEKGKTAETSHVVEAATGQDASIGFAEEASKSQEASRGEWRQTGAFDLPPPQQSPPKPSRFAVKSETIDVKAVLAEKDRERISRVVNAMPVEEN